MKRFLFNSVAGVSLLICLAVAIIWGRSYYQRDKVIPCQGDLDTYLLQSGAGHLLLQKSYYDGSPYANPTAPTWIWDYDSTPTSVPLPAVSNSPSYVVLDHGEFAGFVAKRSITTVYGVSAGLRGQAFHEYWSSLTVPYWFCAVVLLILPGLWLLDFATRHRYHAPGQCHRCGYDLRATPEQCPECGAKALPRSNANSTGRSRPVLMAVCVLLASASIALAVYYPEGGLSWFITPPVRSDSSKTAVAPATAQAGSPTTKPDLPKAIAQNWPHHVHESFRNSVGISLTYIPAGTFVMGSPADEHDRELDETPHRVTLTRPFLMGVGPITPRQWSVVMGTKPGRYYSLYLPMVDITWQEAVDFCDRLSKLEGRNYRLPTEAEWEYACRAGTTTAYYTGASAETLGIYHTGRPTRTSGQRLPNAWGLFDMECNVEQWCSDGYGKYPTADVTDPRGPKSADSFQSRVFRGGSWVSFPNHFRSAERGHADPASRLNDLGFRVAVDAVDQSHPN